MAHRFNITREEMDEFSLQSHQRVARGMEEKHYDEITAAYAINGQVTSADDGARKDTTLEKLGQLKPFFDKKFGAVTAGNSSQISDGSALVLLASKEAVDKYKLPVIGKITDIQWAGLDPAEMGLGPVFATHKVLKNQNLTLSDIDFFEILYSFIFFF